MATNNHKPPISEKEAAKYLGLQEYIEAAELSSGPLFRSRISSSKKRALTNGAMDESTMFRLLTDYLARSVGVLKIGNSNSRSVKLMRY